MAGRDDLERTRLQAPSDADKLSHNAPRMRNRSDLLVAFGLCRFNSVRARITGYRDGPKPRLDKQSGGLVFEQQPRLHEGTLGLHGVLPLRGPALRVFGPSDAG